MFSKKLKKLENWKTLTNGDVSVENRHSCGVITEIVLYEKLKSDFIMVQNQIKFSMIMKISYFYILLVCFLDSSYLKTKVHTIYLTSLFIIIFNWVNVMWSVKRYLKLANNVLRNKQKMIVCPKHEKSYFHVFSYWT